MSSIKNTEGRCENRRERVHTPVFASILPMAVVFWTKVEGVEDGV